MPRSHSHPTQRPDDVPWRDLVPLTRLERLHELTLSLPWLAGSLYAYSLTPTHPAYALPGALCSFFFFLTGLRQSHNAQHGNLGLTRRGHDTLLAALSLAMLASMHAIRATHLHHHRHCLADDDIEASTARMPAWRAIATGPRQILRLHAAALRLAKPNARRWICCESLAILTLLAAVVALPLLLPLDARLVAAARWHALAMLTGECLTGFFAVWTVHHGITDTQPLGRTLRNPWLNRLTYHMLLHAEHHLYPAVPTVHLPEIARRLDASASNLGHTLAQHPVLGRTPPHPHPE